MRRSTWRHWLPAGAFGAVLLLALGLAQLLSIATLKAQQAALVAAYQHHPLAFTAGFVAAQAAALALLIPGSVVVFALAAGAIFGPVAGTAITLGAVTLGDSLGFLIARYLARDWVQRRFGRYHARFEAGLARGGAAYLLSLRLMAAVPFFVVNLAMALTEMRLRVFAPVSLLGIAPATVLYVVAGTELGRIERASDIASWPVIAALAGLAVLPLLLRAVVRRRSVRPSLRPGRTARSPSSPAAPGAASPRPGSTSST